MDLHAIYAGILLTVIAVVVGLRRNRQLIRRALPGVWRSRLGRMTTVWNGHPSSATFDSGGSDSPRVWAQVVIEVCAPAQIRVGRRGADLDVQSDDPAFAQRLFSDPAMAKTLTLALRRQGEELAISPTAVFVRRFAVDGVETEALQSAWALATAVVTALRLPPPTAT